MWPDNAPVRRLASPLEWVGLPRKASLTREILGPGMPWQKGRPRRRKDIMGRKDIMHRTEGAVADLPAVKVRGIAVKGIAAGGVALRALATGAFAAGAAAIGAFAIGAVAVGRLRVGNAAAKKLSVGRLEVEELVIGGKPVRVEDLGPVIGSG